MIGIDPIGTLTQSLARQKQADFMVVSAQKLYEHEHFLHLKNCSYLLSATHPLRELEKEQSLNSANFLTYYAFTTDLSQPFDSKGASAIEVHEMIAFFENLAIQGSIPPSSEVINQAKLAGQEISKWIQNSFSIGGDSLLGEKSNYFVPIPVVLVAIVDEEVT